MLALLTTKMIVAIPWANSVFSNMYLGCFAVSAKTAVNIHSIIPGDIS